MSTDFVLRSNQEYPGNATQYVSASSVYRHVDGPVDGGDNDWLSNGDPSWWMLDVGAFSGWTLHDYSIKASSETSRAPRNFTLAGSNNNSTWTTLDTRTNETGWSSGETRNYVCNSGTAVRYRYFKLNITLNNEGSGYTSVREIYFYTNDTTPLYVEFAPHNMTTNTVPSPRVASASSSYYADSAFRVYDGFYNASGRFWLSTDPVCWHKIDLGAGNEKALYGYIVKVNGIPEPNRAPKTFALQGSNDDSNWTTLDTRANETTWLNSEPRGFTCNAPSATAFRYYKIDITANNGDGTYTQLDEIFLYEPAAAPPAAIKLSPTAAQVIA